MIYHASMTIFSKGQVTIPAEIRRLLKMKKGRKNISLTVRRDQTIVGKYLRKSKRL